MKQGEVTMVAPLNIQKAIKCGIEVNKVYAEDCLLPMKMH